LLHLWFILQRVYEEAEAMAAWHQSGLPEEVQEEHIFRSFEEPLIANQEWLDFGEKDTLYEQ
jgi:hypothetical protein